MSRPERMLFFTAAASFGFAMVAGTASTFDGRILGEDNVWVKPLKFGVSVGIYLATLAWAAGGLSATARHGPAIEWIALTACVCAAFELIYIGLQAFRGEHSHFNTDSPFHAAMFALMAVAAIALALSGGALGLAVARDTGWRFSPTLRWSIAVAFPLSAALTILTGLAMGSRMSHHASLDTAAIRLPLTGWSLTVGDLRAPHFLASHLTQAGPALGWLLTRLPGEGTASPLAVAFCLAWAWLTLILFRLTLAGHPIAALFE